MALCVAFSDGPFILFHKMVSTVAANGMGDSMFVHQVIRKKLFCAEEFAAPRTNYFYVHFHVLPLFMLVRKNFG
jgi:hypothetical protein